MEESDEEDEDEIRVLGVKMAEQMEIDEEDNKGQHEQNSQAKTMERKTYAKAASTQKKRQTLSEEQQVAKLIQPKLDGIPVPNWYIPIFVFSFMWNGPAARMLITKKAIQCLHVIWDALFKTPYKFKILPLDDEKCKNQKLWITNSERAKQLCSHWYQIKNYLDMDFGNLEWLTSQARTTGNKTVRTRIRFAFDDTVEGAMATLSGILEEDGGVVRECPLQINHIGISGCLPFLPPLMSPEMMAHALMKEMGFAFAIALIWDWVSAPSDGMNGGKKSRRKRPSLQMWQILTALKYMPQVGDFMRKLYNPKTPRHLLPWCGISTYFHAWRAASKKWLSVGAHGPIRKMATTLVQKAIDYNSVTYSFCSPIPLPGMLRVVKTEKFGEISLLRFLYSIKATPFQIEAAESTRCEGVSGENTAETESSEKTEKTPEQFIEVTTKKTKKLTKDEQLRQAVEKVEDAEMNDRERCAELV